MKPNTLRRTAKTVSRKFLIKKLCHDFLEILQETANRREDQLSWYRTSLIGRLPIDHSNYDSTPKIRNSTSKISSLFKYAKHCYNLQLYLPGDETAPIDEIFRTLNPIKTNTQPVYSNRFKLAETQTLIQSLK